MNEHSMPALPPAIMRRNPWPSAEAIDRMLANGTLPGGPSHLAARRRIEADARLSAEAERIAAETRYTAWTVDQVTVSACALLADDVLDAIAENLTGSTAPMTLVAECGPHAAHPPLAHLWRGVDAIEVHAFACSRVMAAVRFGRDAGGDLVYADGALAMGGEVPETVRLQALGTEMQGLLPHPVFFAHRWRDEQRSPDVLEGPESLLLLGNRPGLQLARLARADRECVLQAGNELGITSDRAGEPDPDHPKRRDEDG